MEIKDAILDSRDRIFEENMIIDVLVRLQTKPDYNGKNMLLKEWRMLAMSIICKGNK